MRGEIELMLYRIAQEALTNVVRHPHATRVDFALTSSTTGLTLRILDDGQGGDLREGEGIRGMRNRWPNPRASCSPTTTPWSAAASA